MAKVKLFLIDGSAIFYRSYFAFIRNPLINSKGENTSAAFGFLNTVFKLIEDENPEYMGVIFDTKAPTFRHEMYSEYKATREKMPDDMAATIPRLMQSLNTLSMHLMEKDGYEADDIIATLARKYAGDDIDVYIVSGDKDLAQLVNENIFIYSPARSGSQAAEVIGRDGVREKYGVFPEQIVDWLALVGDKSDNVPGVPSVGDVTARALINDFNSLDGIYERVEEITRNNTREKIKENRTQAYLSQKLITLDDQVPLSVSLDDLRLNGWDQREVEVLLKDMEFNRLIVRADKLNKMIGGKGDSAPLAEISQSQKYRAVNSEQDFDLLLNRLRKSKQFVFDLETDSLDVFTARIAGIAICLEQKEAYYIAINHSDSVLDEKKVLNALRPVFADPGIKKIAQNIKFDAMIMEEHGIDVANMYFDTMIASFLINSTTGQHNLDSLAEEYLDYKMIPIQDIIGSGKNQTVMTELPVGDVYKYACEDADITMQLMNIMRPRLEDLGLEELFYQVEMPLVTVLMAMEKQGVKLDTVLLKDLSKQLTGDLAELETRIYELAGETFNINSPQQLGTLLFDKLEIQKALNMRKPPRTKTGQYSTSEQVLERYHRHELPHNILDFRKLTKLKNTYVDALPNLIHAKTGRVHTSFNQTVAATGRLSSVNPNLQNIPIRTEIGREMRRAFISGGKNRYILSADYSQIELRLMAHLSRDKNMCESFRNDEDIHSSTAARIMDIPISQVEPEHRRKAKEINFGIIYGMSKYGLANRLDISVMEAEQFIFEYFSSYPGIQEFMRDTIARADQEGFVRTMIGRIRYLPQIHSTNRQLREFAERTSINTPIQGSAADLIKIAMIHIYDEMRKKGLQSRMILQVHDELVFEVPVEEKDIMVNLVKDKMEHAMRLEVPVKVDIGFGENWLEAH